MLCTHFAGGAMETEERGAWRDYTHACLKSFVRHYNVQVGVWS